MSPQIPLTRLAALGTLSRIAGQGPRRVSDGALQEFIARRRQQRLLDLADQLEWDEGFDYKAERSRR